MISKEEILKAAALAKLKLTAKEEDKFAAELANIVAYVDELKSVDTENIEAVSHITGLENSFREDSLEILEEDKLPHGQDLIGQTPKVKNGYVVVPRILSDL